MRIRIVKYALAVAASAAFVSGGAAFAQQDHPRTQHEKTVSVGVQGDWGNKDVHFGVGGRVIVGLDRIVKGLEEVGSFDWYFPSNGDVEGVDVQYFEVNGNGVYKFDLENSSVQPYLGAGVNVAHAKGGVDFGGGLGLRPPRRRSG